jgi:uncharacterized protein (TIGR02145 family)
MAENLTAEHYANGEPIPHIPVNNALWDSQIQGAWCFYENDENRACPYGKLYNWYVTVDQRNVCPTGWHVPSDLEWTELSNNLGGIAAAGAKMKSAGLEFWLSPNALASNQSGFSGLPGGARWQDGVFFNYGSHGYWWSSSTNLAPNAIGRALWYLDGSIYPQDAGRSYGFSIRCVKD